MLIKVSLSGVAFASAMSLVMFTSSGIAADLSVDVVAEASQTGAPTSITNKSRGEWNGFKGYRHYRNGYRKHTDGWWYPEAAFQPNAKAGVANESVQAIPHKQKDSEEKPWQIKSHVDYCSSKYKTYSASDNTYQPFEGARKACVSPYYKG